MVNMSAFSLQNTRFPGYGMFWLANSISSTMLGLRNREIQAKASERNFEFMREMEDARRMTENQKIQEEIAFKRRLMAISRRYNQEESAKSFSSRMKGIEFKVFLQRYWPLDIQLPSVIIKEVEDSRMSGCNQPLNVILLRSPLLPVNKYGGANNGDTYMYRSIEYSVMTEDICCMGNGDVKFRKDACVNADMTGGNANIMNIHFLMSQIPTLVISPRYQDDRLSFTGAVWEPQVARPLIRPMFSIEYDPIKAENDKNYCDEVIDLVHTSVSTIVCVVRDSYMMLTQGKEPMIGKWLNDGKHDKIKAIIKGNKKIANFIERENNETLSALTIENSPKLFEAYSEEDINKLRKQIQSINI